MSKAFEVQRQRRLWSCEETAFRLVRSINRVNSGNPKQQAVGNPSSPAMGKPLFRKGSNLKPGGSAPHNSVMIRLSSMSKSNVTNTDDQLGKALKEIKRDVERAFVGVDNAAVTGDASTAREMASVTQQIASGNSIDAGSNATDALTEAKILECHQAVFEAGGDPTVLMVKPADATIVSGFTAASGRQRTFQR